MSQAVTLILSLLLSVIGMAIVQDALNKAIDAGMPMRQPLPQARIA
jgi:hypothetical protein